MRRSGRYLLGGGILRVDLHFNEVGLSSFLLFQTKHRVVLS
jgi:hypothetical protein